MQPQRLGILIIPSKLTNDTTNKGFEYFTDYANNRNSAYLAKLHEFVKVIRVVRICN